MVSSLILSLIDWKSLSCSSVQRKDGKSLIKFQKGWLSTLRFLYSNCQIRGNLVLSLLYVDFWETSGSSSPFLVLQKIVFHLERRRGQKISQFHFPQEEERFIGGSLETSLAEESMVFIFESEHFVYTFVIAIFCHECTLWLTSSWWWGWHEL